MRNKNVICLLMSGALAIGALTGCGSSSSKTNTSKETTKTTEKQTREDTKKTTADGASEVSEKETETTLSKIDIDETKYVFGTVNMTYANFYYGELEDILPEDPDKATEGQYDVENPVKEAGFEDEGMYDAVSSATTQKSTKFADTYTEETDKGVDIIGPTNVNVAISKDLYNDVLTAIQDNKECKNELINLVSGMENVSDTAPVEYKVINSDGTLSKTIGNTVVAKEAKATITTTSTWGNYEIDIEGVEIDADTVQGAIMETDDGKKYGLQHLDNLWLQATEIAFSVKEFVDPHDNVAGYKKFEDIEGKTITKITYLIENDDDVEIDTSLYCKEQVNDEYNVTSDKTVEYNSDGTEISVEFNVPSGSDYKLSDVIVSRKSLDKDSYEVSDNVVTLNGDCKPGDYKLVFSDEKYADLQTKTSVESGLAAEQITFDGEKIVVADNDKNLTVSDYLNGISSVSINGEPLTGKNLGSVVFNEDGNINLDAVVKSNSGETPVFNESGDYTVSLEATGYPSLEFAVTK